uniref:Uncharacterized protein n=1 Tax=Arundo donax TaxID=35708 RepID=A0A0A9GEW9_ARUDO
MSSITVTVKALADGPLVGEALLPLKVPHINRTILDMASTMGTGHNLFLPSPSFLVPIFLWEAILMGVDTQAKVS